MKWKIVDLPLLIECQPSTVDTANTWIKHFLFYKLARGLWGTLDRPEMNTLHPGNKMGFSRWCFQRSLVPFHSHTLPYHSEVIEDTQGQAGDIILFKDKSIYSSSPATFSPVSGTAANNTLCKGFEREMTRKGMKGMELSMVTCSPSDLHLFSVQRKVSKIQKVTKYIVTPVSSFHGEY